MFSFQASRDHILLIQYMPAGQWCQTTDWLPPNEGWPALCSQHGSLRESVESQNAQRLYTRVRMDLENDLILLLFFLLLLSWECRGLRSWMALAIVYM